MFFKPYFASAKRVPSPASPLNIFSGRHPHVSPHPAIPVTAIRHSAYKSPKKRNFFQLFAAHFFPAPAPESNKKPPVQKRPSRVHRARSVHHGRHTRRAPPSTSSNRALSAMQHEKVVVDALFEARARMRRAERFARRKMQEEAAAKAREEQRKLMEEELQRERDRAAEALAAAERELRESEERDRQRFEEIMIAHQKRMEEITRRREEQARRAREEELRRQAEEEERQREEERKHQEEVRAREAEWARKLEEMRARQEEEARLERERLHREAEARLAWQAQQRAREEAAQAEAAALVARFDLYERRWAAIKDGSPEVPPLVPSDNIPWPFARNLSTIDEITVETVSEFIFHPLRTCAEGKSRRDRVRAEMLRWHPDKFNAKVMPRIIECEREIVQLAAGAVARVLTELMAAEVCSTT